jgi:hypothetical protein
LWTEVRAAKEMLSRAATAPVHVPGTEDALHLTREELDRVAGPLIDRAVDETRRVLQRAGVGTSHLAGIFLVGGSSRIPLVSSRLHARFEIAPTVPEQPELPVAYGGLIAVGGTGIPAQPPAPPVGGRFPVPGSPVPGSQTSGGIPVSGSPISPPAGFPPVPMSPPGSYPPGPAMSPIPSSTSFPPVPLPQPPPSAPPQRTIYQPVDLPRQAPRRPRWRRYVATFVTVALLAACGWGARGLYRWGSNAFRTATGNSPFGGGDGGGQADGLKVGDVITLPGEGAVAATAGTNTVYTANVGAGKIDVTAYATTGAQTWTKAVDAEPTGVRLSVVGDLLIVDGESSDKHNGDDIRAVLDAKTGTQKWLAAWDNRVDMAYLGTDVIVDFRGKSTSVPPAIERVDLLTGKVKWSRKSTGSLSVNDDRRAKPALDWPKAGAAQVGGVPSYGSFSRLTPFQESLAAQTDVAVQLEGVTPSSGKATVVDLNTGAVKATGAAPINDDKWTVFGGMLVGVSYTQGNLLVGYRLSDMKQAWEFKRPAGSSIDAVKPCAERLVCVKSRVSSDYSLEAIDVSNGQAKWNKKSDNEPAWYVVGGELLYGEGTFTQLKNASVLDRANSNPVRSIGQGLRSPYGYGSRGTKVAMMSFRLAGTNVVWRVSVADIGTGKVSGTADVSADLVQDLWLSDDSIAVIDTDKRKVYRFAIPK